MTNKKSKYTFLWGQKQSAMITGVMANTIPNKGPMNKRISEDLAVCIDGIVENYMPLKAIKEWQSNGNKYYNRKFTEKLFQDIDSLVKEFFVFAEEIKNKKTSELTNKQLKKIIKKEEYFVGEGLGFFATSSPGPTYLVEKRIKEILAKKIKDQNIQEQCFIDLSTPAEMDETMKERIGFFKILKKKKISDMDLENYSRKYPALFMNTYSRKEVLDFLNERIEKEKNSDSKSEEKEIRETIKSVARKHKKIFTEIKNDNLFYFSSILQKAALGRYRLKHVWSGVEYMLLDFLKEISRRVGINLEDMVKTYLFSDIFNFLDKGIVLSRKEIEDRKKCFILHTFYNRKNLFFVGDKALAYKAKKIKEEKISDNIIFVKGQVANKGIVSGSAMVIFVRDIKQFSKDSEAFEVGEILVTTMTSPVMMPIIKKAAAIVTDEGGICSHAAVSAREFNIPCIVGTKIATKVLKDGDLVEVDADKGVVKILKRN